MKLLFASLSALLVILSAITVDGAAVYDISGDELQYGTSYYIQGAGGLGSAGLYPEYRPGPCPLSVAGDPYRGSPLTFIPLRTNDRIVQLNTNLNIKFSRPLPLPLPLGVWKLVDHLDNGEHFVTLCGEPNPIDFINWFKIEKADNSGYKLRYCPGVPGAACGNLGIYSEGGKGWLVLSDHQPSFIVVFVKASSSLALPRSIST